MCPGKFIRSQLLAQQCPFLVKKEVSKEKEEDSKEELLEWMIGPTHQMLDESNAGHFAENFIRLADNKNYLLDFREVSSVWTIIKCNTYQ